MSAKKILYPLVLLSFFSNLSFAQSLPLPLTGDVSADFSEISNCWLDNQDNFPVGTGFDIERVCFFYHRPTDTLTVGIRAHDGAIIGDADGDGDPHGSANAIQDFANMDESETYVISFDLDGDSLASDFDSETVDLMVGVSAESDFSSFGAYVPDTQYFKGYPGIGFGVLANLDVEVFEEPSAVHPDLEFVIRGFTSLDLDADYALEPVLQVFASSISAGGVGSDFLPSASEQYEAYPLYDFDGDTLEDWEEAGEGTDPNSADTDADGLPDGIELNGENPTDPLNDDSDNDGLLDGEEDTDLDGAKDELESDPNKADTDGDGLSDFIEVRGANPTNPNKADTDGEGLLDGQEDENKNGLQDGLETDPNKADTDKGGVDDYIEVETGYDPLDPSDDNKAELASVQNGVGQGYDRVQGGGLFGCQLSSSVYGSSHHHTYMWLSLSALFLMFYTRRQTQAKQKS